MIYLQQVLIHTSASVHPANNSTARKMAPCFLLLDNIEVLLGLRLATNSSLKSGTHDRTRRGGSRTSHQAIDRVLSTLLVELDGISVSKSSENAVSGHCSGTQVTTGHQSMGNNAVIVIATSTCRPDQLDRCIYSLQYELVLIIMWIYMHCVVSAH